MPRYVYKCDNCAESFTTIHGITEDLGHCEVCLEVDCVTRIPQMPYVSKPPTAGALVREHIEETKKELAEEKKKLKTHTRGP